jgi:hypothetical protein
MRACIQYAYTLGVQEILDASQELARERRQGRHIKVPLELGVVSNCC